MKKKNEEKSDPGPHGFTRPIDITRGLEQQEVPVAVHSLSPTTIDEISKIGDPLVNFFFFFDSTSHNGRSATITEQRTISSRNTPLSATHSLARCSHGRARRKEARERNETKRSADRTQLAGAAGPRMPCGPAGSGTLARVGRIKRQA